ncbi:MAG: hydrocarbon-binding protein [Scytonema sp. RU_4_4]|nr:hydrocarbon-binding protein [Scytonema sp. RU_4_4]
MLRPNLGDFNSIVCFKAAIIGMEEALGEKATAIALISAGRHRGKVLAKELALTDSSISFDELTDKISFALGKNGSRLCIVKKITKEGEFIKVYTSETLCSTDEPQGSKRTCTFTLGTIWGMLEVTFGKRLQGKHIESVLRGSEYDVFEFTELV